MESQWVETSIGTLIWSQISRDTKWACGARQAVASDEGLHFTVTVEPNQRHKIEVVYNYGPDLYTVKLWKMAPGMPVVVKELEGVYDDMLSSVIYDFCNKA